jgi:hypothetical protein
MSANDSSNYSLLLSLLSALTSAVAGNGEYADSNTRDVCLLKVYCIGRNCQYIYDLGFIPLLIQLLRMDADDKFRLQVILAVGYCTEACGEEVLAYMYFQGAVLPMYAV